MSRHTRLAAFVCAAAIVSSCDRTPTETPISYSPHVADARYFAHDLGALSPADSSAANAIADTGVIVGSSSVGGGAATHAVLWDVNHTIVDLSFVLWIGGLHASAQAVNIHSTVVGWSDTLGGTRAFVWRPGSFMQALPSLGFGLNAVAMGVNDADTAVGASDTPGGQRVAVRWDLTTNAIQTLGTLPGGANSIATAINNHGVSVGSSQDVTTNFRAVRWSFIGTISALALPPGATSSEAAAINDGGEIVGTAFGGLATQGVFWNAAGVPTNLGTLPGGTFSRASGINRHGDIVGTSTDATGNMRAVLWKRGGGGFRIEDLGTLPGHTYAQANGINRGGDVAGQSGTFSFPSTRATCWGPRRGC